MLTEPASGKPNVVREGNDWRFVAPAYLGEMARDDIRVELYADPVECEAPETIPLERGDPIPGAMNGYLYAARVPTSRPPGDFTARIVPHHAGVHVPAELPLIRWQT
jgi:starch phosphorylase